MSPFLFAIYIDDINGQLRNSSYGSRIGNAFACCLLSADDIAHLSCTCYGLQKLINICSYVWSLRLVYFIEKSGGRHLEGYKLIKYLYISRNCPLYLWATRRKSIRFLTSYAGGRHNMPRPLQVDLWPFDLESLKVVSESRVTWASSMPILVFLGLSVLDLGPMYAI